MAVVIMFFFASNSFAQKTKTFQGTITYNISYTGGNITPAEKAQLPTTSTVTIKDCKTKTEAVSGPVTQAAVTDGATKSVTVFIDFGDTMKYVIKLAPADLAEELAAAPAPTVNITTETKVISGFNCKKAILTTKEDSTITTDTIYFTEEIGCKDLNFSNPNFKDIPGAVLQYSEFNSQLNATAVYTVSEIKKSKVSDNIFLIPSNFRELTKEQATKMFGGE